MLLIKSSRLVKVILWWLLIACVVQVPLAHAGAGAIVEACVYLLPGTVTKPITFRFTAGGGTDLCMYETGNDVLLQIQEAGLACASLGYVEGKSSSSGGDMCATSLHMWNVSYESDAEGGLSGEMQANLSHPLFGSNYLSFWEPSCGVFACTEKQPCRDKIAAWPSGTVGRVYLVFAPYAQAYGCL